MKGLTRKRLAAGVILLAALVLCGWLFGWWRGGTIDVLDFDAEEVESVSMSVARFGYWDPLVLTEKDEIQDVIDRLNGLDYTGKMVRHRLGYALQNNFFIGGCSVLYEFGFTFTDGTSRCLLMFPHGFAGG